MKIVNALFITSLLFLTACAKEPPTTAVVTVEKPALIIPNVDKIRLREVQFHVLNENTNIKETLTKANSSSLFAVSAKGYENLSLNTAELRKSIEQLQAQINAYKEYYKKESTTVKQTKE